MKENLTTKTFVGFFWSAGGKITSAIAQIAVLAILARIISIESFGLVQAALIVVGFAKIVSQMGIGPAIVQKNELTENHIRVGFTFSLILGLVLGMLTFLSSELISSFFKFENLPIVLKTISLIFLFESYVTVSYSLLQRRMRFKELAVIEIISYIFGYGAFGIIFGYLGFDYWALVIAIFAQVIIKIVAYTIVLKHNMIPLWKKREFNDLIYFGGGFTIAKILNYIANQGDNIITGRILGAESLGIYSRAYTIMANPVRLIGDSIDKALFPAMAARQNQKEQLVKGFINGSKLIFLMSVPIIVVIYISSHEIVSVLLGEKWREAVVPLQVLTLGLYFRMGYKMGDNLCRATGEVYKRAWRQLLYAIAVIFGTYLGAKWNGIIGVAYGTLFAIFINYILMIGLSLKILEKKWIFFLKNIVSEIHVVLIFSLCYVIPFYIIRNLADSDFIVIATSGFVSFSLIALILYLYHDKLEFIKLLPYKLSKKFKK